MNNLRNRRAVERAGLAAVVVVRGSLRTVAEGAGGVDGWMGSRRTVGSRRFEFPGIERQGVGTGRSGRLDLEGYFVVALEVEQTIGKRGGLAGL
jgi:hypothetical protein